MDYLPIAIAVSPTGFPVEVEGRGEVDWPGGLLDYESFIYKSSCFKVSLPQCAQDSIAWESYVIMYINDINQEVSTGKCRHIMLGGGGGGSTGP